MNKDTTIDGVNYGPLAALLGTWEGDKGVDRAPEPDGEERNPYYETIVFQAGGDVTNAEQQTLSVVRYHQVVSRKSNDQVFHDQVGYWLWDPADDTIVETFTIPRGVAVVAGGKLGQPDDLQQELVFEVAADAASPEFGIVQAPFMFRQAKTTAFRHTLTVQGDVMRYSESTILDIYDKTAYDHKDVNTLRRTELMDPLTQGVLGASLPQASSRARYAGSAGLLGFLAGMAADLDVLIRSSTDPAVVPGIPPSVHPLPGVYTRRWPDLCRLAAFCHWSQAGPGVPSNLAVLHAGLRHSRGPRCLHNLRHHVVLAVQ